MKKIKVFKIFIKDWKILKKPNKIKKITNAILYNIKTFKYILIIKLLNNFKLLFNN